MSFAQGMGATTPLRASSALKNGKFVDTVSSNTQQQENISLNNKPEEIVSNIDTTSDKVDLKLIKKESFDISLNGGATKTFNNVEEAFSFIKENLESGISIKFFTNGKANRKISLNITQSFSLE